MTPTRIMTRMLSLLLTKILNPCFSAGSKSALIARLQAAYLLLPLTAVAADFSTLARAPGMPPRP